MEKELCKGGCTDSNGIAHGGGRSFCERSGGRAAIPSTGQQPMRRRQDILSAAGYERSRIILTACELELFTQIHQKATTARQLARTNGLNPAATTRLLDCLVTFDLLSKSGGQYAVTAGGALLSAGSPENIMPFMKVMNRSWDNWNHLTEIVKEGHPPKDRSEREEKKGVDNDFIELMHLLGSQLSSEIAEIYDLSPFTRMLDIGGASGTYTIAFLKKNPAMKATLFDLDAVLPLAEARLRSEGLVDRVELCSGDYNREALPEGYDLVLLSDVVGQNTNDQNVRLLKKIHRSLKSDGVLLIRDYVMDETHTSPEEGVLFSMLMLVETQGVGAYSFPEYKDVLEEAGFADTRLFRKGQVKDSLVETRKPNRAALLKHKDKARWRQVMAIDSITSDRWQCNEARLLTEGSTQRCRASFKEESHARDVHQNQ